MNDLDELAKKYGTDKQISNGHGYTKYYDRKFCPLRHLPLNILEIGVHMGFSLKMWADYFPNANIWGIDDGSSGDLCRTYDNSRIHFREGSQINNEFLMKVCSEVGQLDIIMDDGSHYSSDITHTFNFMFGQYLKSGGYYVVEDLHCSYPPYSVGPLSSRFNSANKTAVQYFFDIINSIHCNPNQIVEEMTIYPQMTFLKKR